MRDRFYFNSLTDLGLEGAIVPFLQHGRAKGWDTLAPPKSGGRLLLQLYYLAINFCSCNVRLDLQA